MEKKSKSTWSVIIKVVIAVASALACLIVQQHAVTRISP